MENIALSLLLLIILAILPVQADTIYFQNGTMRANLTVKEDSYQKVVYETDNGSNIQIASHIAVKIEYSDAPGAYVDGQNALLRGDYATAIQAMTEAIQIAEKPPLVRSWIRHYALFNQARAYHSWAESTNNPEYFQRALATYQKTLESYPKGRFVLECYWQKAQLYLLTNEYVKAIRELESLSSLSEQTESKNFWQFKIEFLYGHIAKAKNDFGQAIEQYTKAKKLAESQKRISELQEVVLAIGNIYIYQQDFSRAENYFSKLIQEYPGQKEIEAGVKNGLAWCAFHQQKYNQSRILALEVFLKYPQVIQQQAMALFILGKSYEKIPHFAKSNFSQIYLDWLKAGYPDSEWAKQVKVGK